MKTQTLWEEFLVEAYFSSNIAYNIFQLDKEVPKMVTPGKKRNLGNPVKMNDFK